MSQSHDTQRETCRLKRLKTPHKWILWDFIFCKVIFEIIIKLSNLIKYWRLYISLMLILIIITGLNKCEGVLVLESKQWNI